MSKSHPFLAASPDAIIDDNSIAEVKCPYTSKNEKISEESVSFLKSANESLELDKSHDYYYQIQGQLFCTERTNCILVVYTFKDLKIIDVPRDQELICTMLEKLESFFDQHFKKAMLNKFYYHIWTPNVVTWTVKMWNILLCILLRNFWFWIITMFIFPRFLKNTLIFKLKYLVLFSLFFYYYVIYTMNRVWGNQQHCQYHITSIWYRFSETPLNIRYVHVLKINNISLNEEFEILNSPASIWEYIV